MRNRISRTIYLVVAHLFLIGILTQVYLVGLSLLGKRPSWDDHIGLGHSLSGFVLLMIIFAYLGRLPRSMKLLTWLSSAMYVLIADIVIFMRDSAPLIAALHPMLALILFSVVVILTIRIWVIVRTSQPETALAPKAPTIVSTAK